METATLFSLPNEDVLFKKIFIYLSLKDLSRLKLISIGMLDTVNNYISSYLTDFDFSCSASSKKFDGNCFRQMLESKINILKLNMTCCKSWLKDKDLIPVIQQNAQLTDIYLHECYNITNKSFMMIANLHELQVLDLSFCRELSAEVLTHIGANISTLVSLDISGCWSINDASLEIVAMHNKGLVFISCASCYALTDASIMIVAKSCVNLKVVDIRGCWRVKDASIITINEYCKNLEKLLVKDCTHITEISIARLRPRGIHVDIPKPYDFLNSRIISCHMSPMVQT